ncbi:MAG TPA: response regulator, partial [Bacteroidetes bacterium]|nr:response regulator [Bacteroidota bacterium]
MPSILLLDNDSAHREVLAKALEARGLSTLQLSSPREAVHHIRSDRGIDVVVLNREMQGLKWEELLRDIRVFRPEVQFVLLTGYGSTEAALLAGRMDVFSYLERHVSVDELVRTIRAARDETARVRRRQDLPIVVRGSFWRQLLGVHNWRPGLIFVGLLLFTAWMLMPLPGRLQELLSLPAGAPGAAALLGYADYAALAPGETVSEHYLDLSGLRVDARAWTPAGAAARAWTMIGLLALSALFWATGAIPMGVTALAIAAGMAFFGVLGPDQIARAFAQDAVFFIFGVLALSQV